METPCGEEAWALVTEYIEGTALSDLMGARERGEYLKSRDYRNDASVHFHTVDMKELCPIVSLTTPHQFLSVLVADLSLIGCRCVRWFGRATLHEHYARGRRGTQHSRTV